MLLRSFPSFFYGNLHDFYKSPFYGPFIHLQLTRFLRLNPAVNPNRPTPDQKTCVAASMALRFKKLNAINSKSL